MCPLGGGGGGPFSLRSRGSVSHTFAGPNGSEWGLNVHAARPNPPLRPSTASGAETGTTLHRWVCAPPAPSRNHGACHSKPGISAGTVPCPLTLRHPPERGERYDPLPPHPPWTIRFSRCSLWCIGRLALQTGPAGPTGHRGASPSGCPQTRSTVWQRVGLLRSLIVSSRFERSFRVSPLTRSGSTFRNGPNTFRRSAAPPHAARGFEG